MRPKIGNRDYNEPFLRKCLDAIGAHCVQHCPVGWDITVFWRGVYIVEVKSAPDAELTDNEIATQQAVIDAGGAYHIVVTPLQLFTAIGYDIHDASVNELLQLYEVASNAAATRNPNGEPAGASELVTVAGRLLGYPTL